MEQERYLTVSEARKLMGVSVTKMTRLLKSGELPSSPGTRDKRKKLIRLSDVNRWLDEALKEIPAA
jgi:excisionase family DNA binding protein